MVQHCLVLVLYFKKSKYPKRSVTYIPDRYDEGHGTQRTDYQRQTKLILIIALDCSHKTVDHIAYAKKKSIDFIICDHRPGDNLCQMPVAVLDPKKR
jgi:single-stranded-DNA-specific exonuclease